MSLVALGIMLLRLFASRCARDMLPQIFRLDDSLLAVSVATERQLRLKGLQASLSVLRYMGLVNRSGVKLEIQRLVNPDDRRSMPILAASATIAFVIPP